MPDTIIGLIILLFAVLPGVPAYSIYKTFFGSDWRETEWDKIITVVIFSLLGIVTYIIVSTIIRLPSPIYIIPATFNPDTFGVASLLPIALSVTGHFVFSILIAIVAVLITRFFGRWTPSTPYPAAWDDFIRQDVQRHWVVVRLTNNEAYAGYIKNADASVSQSERDIVLAEPALYSEKEKNYRTIPYRQLFLPASMISSIATVHDPDSDKRITKIGTNLFTEDVDDVRR